MDEGVGSCALLGYREERCVLAGDAASVRVAAVSWRLSRGSLRPPTDADIEMLSRAVQAPAPPDVVMVAISACQRVGADWKASVWKAVVGALEGGAVYKETASVEKGGSYLVVFTLAPSAVTPHSVVVGGFEALGRHSTAALVSCGEQGGTFCFANWAFPRRTNRHEEREQAYYTFLGETYQCLGLRNTRTPSFPLSLLSKTPAALQHSSKVWVSSGGRDEGAAGLGSLLHDGARLLSSCDYLFVAGALESRLCDGRDQLARSMQRRRCFAPNFVDLEPASAPGALTSYLDAAKTFPGDPAPPLKPGVAGGRCTRVLLHAAFSRDALAPPSPEEAGGGVGAPAPGGSVLPPTAPRVLACKVVPFGRVKDRPLAALVDVVVLRAGAGAAASGQEMAEAALLRRVEGAGASLPVLEADEAVARRGCVLVEASERATLRELSLLLAGWTGVAAGQARRRALRLLQLSGADAPADGAVPETCDEDAASSEDSVSDDDDADAAQHRRFEQNVHPLVAPPGYAPWVAEPAAAAAPEAAAATPPPPLRGSDEASPPPSTGLEALLRAARDAEETAAPLNPDTLFASYTPPTPPPAELGYLRADEAMRKHMPSEASSLPRARVSASPPRTFGDRSQIPYVYGETAEAGAAPQVRGSGADAAASDDAGTEGTDADSSRRQEPYYSPAYYLPPWLSLLWSVCREAFVEGRVETCGVERIALSSLANERHWDMLHERGLLSEGLKQKVRERELTRRSEEELAEMQLRPKITKAARVIPTRGEFYRYAEDWKHRAMADREAKNRLKDEASLEEVGKVCVMSARSRQIIANSVRRDAISGDGYKSPVTQWEHHAIDHSAKKHRFVPTTDGPFTPVINQHSHKMVKGKERGHIAVRMAEKVAVTKRKLDKKYDEQWSETYTFKPEVTTKKPNRKDPDAVVSSLLTKAANGRKKFEKKKDALFEEECPFKPELESKSKEIIARRPPRTDIGTRSASPNARSTHVSPSRARFSKKRDKEERELFEKYPMKKMTSEEMEESAKRLYKNSNGKMKFQKSVKKLATQREEDDLEEMKNETFQPRINKRSTLIIAERQSALKQHIDDGHRMSPPPPSPAPSESDVPHVRRPARSLSPNRPLTSGTLLRRPRHDADPMATPQPRTPANAAVPAPRMPSPGGSVSQAQYYNTRGGSLSMDQFMVECSRLGINSGGGGGGDAASRSVSASPAAHMSSTQFYTPLRSASSAAAPWLVPQEGASVQRTQARHSVSGQQQPPPPPPPPRTPEHNRFARRPAAATSATGAPHQQKWQQPEYLGPEPSPANASQVDSYTSSAHRDTTAKSDPYEAIEHHLSTMCSVLDEYRSLEGYASTVSLRGGVDDSYSDC